MRRVYLAHALSAETREGIEQNRRKAIVWARWISRTFRVAVSADWLWMTSDQSDENREWGLACDKAHIERCDELWMVGPRVSSGMALERQWAWANGVPTYDLTGLAFGDKETEHWVRLALAEQGWRP